MLSPSGTYTKLFDMVYPSAVTCPPPVSETTTVILYAALYETSTAVSPSTVTVNFPSVALTSAPLTVILSIMYSSLDTVTVNSTFAPCSAVNMPFTISYPAAVMLPASLSPLTVILYVWAAFLNEAYITVVEVTLV